MNSIVIGRWNAIPTASVLAIVAGTALTLGASAIPAEAQMLDIRRGVAVSESGVAGRTRGFVSNGEGAGAFRRGGFAIDDQGNGGAGRGGCVAGQTGNGCRGGSASWSSDGLFSGQSGAEFSGDNGFFSSRSTLERDADGDVTGTRSADASATAAPTAAHRRSRMAPTTATVHTRAPRASPQPWKAAGPGAPAVRAR